MTADDALTLTDDAIHALADELTHASLTSDHRRLIVGLAGIPGSGKSTLAGILAQRLPHARLVPMDGFHLTNAQLRERELMERKGSPESFDAAAYIATLQRFADRSQTGPYPIYDRRVHEPVIPGDAAHTITDQTRLIVTEGNYLLLDEPPWRELASVLDWTWWLDTPVEQAREWLFQRHRNVGRTQEEAEARYACNDGHNVQRVLEHRQPPDRVLRWPMTS